MKINQRIIKTMLPVCLIATSLITISVGNVHAKWWIFGKGEKLPEVTRVYVCGADIEEVEETLILYKENLELGKIVIKGYASKAKSVLAAAQYSLDGGKTWKDADISKKGIFIISFTPVVKKEYKLAFRVMDSAGKKSEEDDIQKIKLVYSGKSYRDAVKSAVNELRKNYIAQNINGFMEYVSEDFKGDDSELEDALENDFNRYSRITLDINIDKMTANGIEAKVDFRFDWSVVVSKTGATIRPPQDNTSFVFRLEGDRYKLLDMSYPVIFGVTRGSSIATGSTSGTSHGSTAIFLEEEGEGGDEDEEGEGGDEDEEDDDPVAGLPSGTVTLAVGGDGYDFSDELETPWAGGADILFYYIAPPDYKFETAGICSDQGTDFNITNVIVTGSSNHTSPVIGRVYAFTTNDSKFVKIKVTAIDTALHTMTFDWVYQPDGSNHF